MNVSSRGTQLLDRLWLWGMKQNVLQQSPDYRRLAGFKDSTMTVEQAIRLTGIRNVVLAGGLEIDQASLNSMPSAQRIICKWSLHEHVPDGVRLNIEGCAQRLRATKRLCAEDRRIESFLLDDFSTGSMNAGALPSHIAQLQRINATVRPPLPLNATIYPQSLDRPGLAEMLRYFDQILFPLWYVSQVDNLPRFAERCAELSGGKPMLACLYFYDFGNGLMLSRDQMQRQLDVLTEQLESGQVTGAAFCGTCMLDLGWESVECWRDWLGQIGGGEADNAKYDHATPSS